ncbi:MAG: hypothetical protein HDT32_04990 [Clostridiales bacterium]|nr:hypothetical protein [Clostridiales bacterium]
MERQNNDKLPWAYYQREIRCPRHNKLLGRYDGRCGVINATYFCPQCKQEYTFTIKGEKNPNF